eukprot:Em0005g699a
MYGAMGECLERSEVRGYIFIGGGVREADLQKMVEEMVGRAPGGPESGKNTSATHTCLLAPLPEENTRGLTSRGSKHDYFPAGVSALPQIQFPVREALKGAWGLTARDFFSKLGSRLATSLGKSKSVVTHELYGRMSMNLVRANATAILSRGGLGLQSLSHHSSAAYISSICSSGFGSKSVHHLSQAVEVFNNLVFPVEAINVESVLLSPPIQKTLSSKFDDHLFNNLLIISSMADKARLLSISSPHASAWLSVTPSEGLGLYLDPPVFQIAVKWWLGLDTSEGSQCTLCPGVLDHLGHHAVTCKYGGDVVSRHNKIRDILVETCRRAHIGVQVEVGNNLTHDHNKTRPADILLSNWFLGKPAALDVSITSPLNPLTLLEAGVLAKSAAPVTEARKHQANAPKCSELGWVCVPMVAESYGAWGDEASSIISSIASRLATSTCKSKSVVLNDIYGRLNVHLVRANATAILSRIIPLS